MRVYSSPISHSRGITTPLWFCKQNPHPKEQKWIYTLVTLVDICPKACMCVCIHIYIYIHWHDTTAEIQSYLCIQHPSWAEMQLDSAEAPYQLPFRCTVAMEFFGCKQRSKNTSKIWRCYKPRKIRWNDSHVQNEVWKWRSKDFPKNLHLLGFLWVFGESAIGCFLEISFSPSPTSVEKNSTTQRLRCFFVRFQGLVSPEDRRNRQVHEGLWCCFSNG